MSYCADLPANPAIRRILVLKWSAMGDVIIATALFEDIARADVHATDFHGVQLSNCKERCTRTPGAGAH